MSSDLVDIAFLDKAAAAFDATPVDSRTTSDVPDQDPHKLAEDLYQVFVSFNASSGQFAKVDSDYSSNWKAQWDPLAKQYGVQLQRAKIAAQDGASYIDDFITNVSSKFSAGETDVAGDKKRLKDWLDAHASNDRLALETQQISQAFLNLADSVTTLRDSFSTFSSQKGVAYDADLARLNNDIRDLQDRIKVEQSEAAKAQIAVDSLVGALATVVGLFETMFSLGQNRNNLEQAQEIFLRHVRAEQELRQQKDRVAAQAAALAKGKSQLIGVRNALSILAQDVIDVSGRVGRMANLWATAHSNFRELRTILDDTTGVYTATFFRKKVKLIGTLTAVFSAEMKRFVTAVDKIKSAQDLVAYLLSPQYGGSDTTRGSLFNDARALELDPQRPIISVEVLSGWVVDGFRVTYRLRNGQTQKISHGTGGNLTGPVLTLQDNEYISGVTGKSGHADNGELWMGDCLQQLQLKVTNSSSGAQRTFGPYGSAKDLAESATTTIAWSGRLLAFAGRAFDTPDQVGLRGISFAERFTGTLTTI